jgi:ABC-2 type transport system ATP-binding protein
VVDLAASGSPRPPLSDNQRPLPTWFPAPSPLRDLMSSLPAPSNAQGPAVLVEGVSRRFGNLLAVDKVSFQVRRGEILGFIGPNGAGKTTTMRMITGYLPATEGRAVVAGFDVFENSLEVRKRVGYLPERPPLYPELTIGSYLQFVAEIRGVPAARRDQKIGETMERVGLRGWEDRILGSLSKGYRQRVGLAQAVLHDPEVVVLDEPTSGLDPAQVVDIREFIRDLSRERAVILSTHILSEVERLCERAVIIARGRVLADDSLQGIRGRVPGGVRYRVELEGAPGGEVGLASMVGRLPEISQVTPRIEADRPAGAVMLEIEAPADPRTAIARLATQQGWTLRAMERTEADLEAAFLHIVGKEGATAPEGADPRVLK